MKQDVRIPVHVVSKLPDGISEVLVYREPKRIPLG